MQALSIARNFYSCTNYEIFYKILQQDKIKFLGHEYYYQAN